MVLKYDYREVFYHKVLRPLRLYKLLEDLDERITTLEESSDDDEDTG